MLTLQNYVGNVQRNLCRSSLSSALLQMANLQATLRVVYKVSAPNANSGVFIRIPVQPKSEDDAINKGIEVQIDESGDDFHCTGVLYSMTEAKARPYKPAGEWNTLEITLKGQRTIVTLNGVQ